MNLRATRDIDFVIEADADCLRDFAQITPADEYYVDEDAARQALPTRVSSSHARHR